MKLGIFSDEISQDLGYSLKIIKELGAGYVELRSMWGKNLMDLSSGELSKAKELIEKSGLKVCAIASPILKCHLREKEAKRAPGNTHLAREQNYSRHLEILEHSFDLARMFDTNIVRAFGFWRTGDLTDEVLDEILQRFEIPVKRAEEENIILALENEHQCFIRNGKESRQFLDRISSKNVRLIWDPGNAFFSGEIPYPDGYGLIKDPIVHVHVKDAGKDEKGRPIWLPVGKGEIDFRGQFQALREGSFSGVLSLETHYVPEGGSKEDGTGESFTGMISILQSLGIEGDN